MSNKKPSAVRAIIRPLLPAYITLFLFSAFNPIMYLAGPIFAQQVFERVAHSRNEATLWVMASIAFFVLAIFVTMGVVRKRTLERLGVVLDEKLTAALFDALHREKTSVEATTPPLGEINRVREILSGSLVGYVCDAFWSPILVVVMFLIHPAFGYVALALITISMLLAIANHGVVSESDKNFQSVSAKAGELGTSILRNIESIRALGMLARVRDRWYIVHRAALGWQAVSSRRTRLIGGLVRYFRYSQPVIIITVGALLYLHDGLPLTMVIAASIIMLRGIVPLENVINNWRLVTTMRESISRLDALLLKTDREAKPIALPRPQGTYTVSRLVGGVPGGDKIVIQDASFSLQPGTVLGIVGPSGAGKSSLCRMLVGIWKPRRGGITLGEHELTHWNEDDLGQYIGYVPQDIDILPGTIGQNIARFDDELEKDSSKLLAAGQLAGIGDLIKSLPQGYNTKVGRGGTILSGGQRQRVALARAVYGDPYLVVLDEPSSNLDSAGELSLQTTVSSLRSKGTIVVLVSHKKSLLSVCDDVLVINQGVMQAYGPRSQIVDRMGGRSKSQTPLTVVEGSAGMTPKSA